MNDNNQTLFQNTYSCQKHLDSSCKCVIKIWCTFVSGGLMANTTVFVQVMKHLNDTVALGYHSDLTLPQSFQLMAAHHSTKAAFLQARNLSTVSYRTRDTGSQVSLYKDRHAKCSTDGFRLSDGWKQTSNFMKCDIGLFIEKLSMLKLIYIVMINPQLIWWYLMLINTHTYFLAPCMTYAVEM